MVIGYRGGIAELVARQLKAKVRVKSINIPYLRRSSCGFRVQRIYPKQGFVVVVVIVWQDVSVYGVFSSDNQAGQPDLAGVKVTYSDLSQVSRDVLQQAKVRHLAS